MEIKGHGAKVDRWVYNLVERERMSIEIIWNIPTLIEVILKIKNYFNWDITKRRTLENQAQL
jgi:hypothetical protein